MKGVITIAISLAVLTSISAYGGKKEHKIAKIEEASPIIL